MIKLKETGLDWLGQIPEHWKLSSIGQEYNLRNEKVSDSDYQPLSVTKLPEGIVLQLENVAKSDAHDNRKLVLKNDFVINSRSDRKMSCGVSNYDGSVSLINIVLEHRKNIIPRYTHYLLKNYGFAEEFYRWGHGIVADLWTTGWDEMKKISIPLPSVEEQQKIADLLDKKCLQIDELISIQEQEIGKLKEYKTAVITKAVTKGLDTSVSMKDTGIAWIGEIPEHWELKKLKYISNKFSKGNGITKEDIVENGDTPCVRYADIYTKYQNSFTECKVRTNKDKIASPQYFENGDILFTATGELVEEIGKSIAYLGNEKCLAGGDVIILKHTQNPEFFGYALDSHYARIQKGYGKTKLKVVHTSVSIIGNMYVALPNLEEQAKIVEYLNKKSFEIDSLIDIKNKKIEELKTYKKSMIYEYVTGKRSA